MKNIAYSEIKSLNWSTLKSIAESPSRLRHNLDHPEEMDEDKEAWRLGRLIHCAILEPSEIGNRYVVIPSFGDLRTKVGKAARDEWMATITDDIEVITEQDRDTASRCARAVAEFPPAVEALAGARCEQVITWEFDGVKCKGRADAITNRIIDIKTTRRTSVQEFERDAAAMLYHGQLAWYHDGAVKAGLIDGKLLPALIVIHFTPKSSFVDVAVFEMTGGTYEYGRGKYQCLLNKYIACMETNYWPGMAARPALWCLPEWILKRDENEVKISTGGNNG